MLLNASDEMQSVIKDTDYVAICTLIKILFGIVMYSRAGASLSTL